MGELIRFIIHWERKACQWWYYECSVTYYLSLINWEEKPGGSGPRVCTMGWRIPVGAGTRETREIKYIDY